MENTNTKIGRADIYIKWIMFTAAITGMALLSAFYPIEGNLPFIVIPSILVLIFAKPVFFEKLKLTTLLTMRILIIFAAMKLFNPQVYVDVIMFMLIINILEATLTDLFRYKKYYNAVSGFAVALGVIALRGLWQFDAPFGDYYLTKGALPIITLFYAIAYTIWNWIFVTNEFSSSVALMHVGFLTAPLLGSLCTVGLGDFGGIGFWLLLRANSLAIGGWMQIGAKDWFEREFYNEKFDKFVKWTKSTPVQIVCMLINLALIATCIILMLKNGGITYTLAPFAAK